MMDILTLGERILIYRKRAGLTKADLAAKLGVDTAEITKYENDDVQPDADILARLAAEFSKSVDEIIYGV